MRDPGASIPLKVWRARPIAPHDAALLFPTYERAAPGDVLSGDRADAVVVRTGDAAVALLELQKAGGRRLAAATFASEIATTAQARFVNPTT